MHVSHLVGNLTDLPCDSKKEKKFILQNCTFFIFSFFYLFVQTGKRLTMTQFATKLKTRMEVFTSPNRDSSTRLNLFTEEDH